MTDNNFDSSSDSDFDGNLGDGATPAPDLTDRVTRLAMLLRHADMASHPGHPFGGVRAGQGRVLHVLSLRSPMPQRELAYMLGVRPQSLSEVLGKLESAGFITRERDTTDRRTFLVDLTDTGRDAAGSSPATEDPFDVLDADEQQALSDMLSRVTTALREKFPDLPERPHGRGPHGHGGHGGHDHGPHGHGGPGFDGARGGHGGRGGRGGHGGHGGRGHGHGPAGTAMDMADGWARRMRGRGFGRGFGQGFGRGFGLA
ncbi:MarR family winged helix-turn-helix transcriptional regulator [Corynebacterium nuruki]|jgi:DNA-binding MarR family transcriptional regulator|uniref:MarR family winged helix-turn-helix transcriptional regulator n=1 Tax=Corynebacterium nuruki TaxID=1032851 RepID=UPI0002487706|nr:MarR family transcriptional regulator [Corynebacterium nuruki]